MSLLVYKFMSSPVGKLKLVACESRLVAVLWEGDPPSRVRLNDKVEHPYGETRSYAQIAKQIGCPKAVRAVGAANGKNPISIVVPCHRVIGSNGALTGFAGGLNAKAFLLERETKGTIFSNKTM